MINLLLLLILFIIVIFFISYNNYLYKKYQNISNKKIKEYEEKQKINIQNKINLYEKEAIYQLNKRIEIIREQKQKELDSFSEQVTNQIEELSYELKNIQDEISIHKKEQDYLNKQIYERKKSIENINFHKIILDDQLNDIKILNSIRDNLKNKNDFDKFIYEVYISKPTNDMIKRVTKNEQISGIYKITRLNTGEIYIGKSTDIKKRFQQHIKTVYNCGQIASSLLHTTMKKDGIDNYTFEIIEKVGKENLAEREKFWINYYNTTIYGLNQRK